MINSFINNLSDDELSDDEDQISDIEDMDDDNDNDNDTKQNQIDSEGKEIKEEESEEIRIRNELLAEALGIDPKKLNASKADETTKYYFYQFILLNL